MGVAFEWSWTYLCASDSSQVIWSIAPGGSGHSSESGFFGIAARGGGGGGAR